MEYTTRITDDSIEFTDRWGDIMVFEYNSEGRVEVVLGTGDSVLLEKPQVLDLIQRLIKHISN
jgi:hypothetical protein